MIQSSETQRKRGNKMKFFKSKFLVVAALANGTTSNMEVFADDEAAAKRAALAGLSHSIDGVGASIITVFPVVFA